MLKQKDFDLGHSKIKDLFFTIWIPTLISVVITGTFVVFDGIFVTHGFHSGDIFGEIGWHWDTSAGSYGANGATAIGYAIPYTLILVSAGIMVGGAISYNLSKARAANDKIREQQIMDSFLPICFIIGLVLTLLLLPFAKVWIWIGSGFQPFFKENWLNNPLMNSEWAPTVESGGVQGHILQQGAWYLRIQAFGTIPYIALVAAPYLLREEGKPIVSIYVNLLGLGTNIVLDFLFVIVFGMNLVGAAFATLLAQSFGTFCFIYYLKTRSSTTTKRWDWKTAKQDVGGIFKNGSSYMGLELLQVAIIFSMILSIGFVFYNDFDTILFYSASFQDYSNFCTLLSLIALATIVSVVPLINYNYNINDQERLHEARKLGFRVLAVVTAALTLVVLLFPVIVTKVFVAPDDWLAQRICQIMIIGFAFGNFILFVGLYFQALGEVKKANIIIFSKPILLFGLALLIGFTVQDAKLAWNNSFLPWNASYDGNGLFLPGSTEPIWPTLGIFWVLPVVDIFIGTISLFWMYASIEKRGLYKQDKMFKKMQKEILHEFKAKNTIIKKYCY